MEKILELRKTGPSRFIETIETEGSPLRARRQYSQWEQVDERLRGLGLEGEEISRVKTAFDSETNVALIRLPYHRGDTISLI